MAHYELVYKKVQNVQKVYKKVELKVIMIQKIFTRYNSKKEFMMQ